MKHHGAVLLDAAVEAGDWSGLGDPEGMIRRGIEAAFAVACDAPRDDVEISVLLTDDDGIREINKAWRGQDKATNVLSFPAPELHGAPGARPLGDLAFALETLRREADDEGKSLADHFTHLVVHGALHLLGYDHELEAEAEIMEALEVKALATLGIADPYRDIGSVNA